MSARLRILAVGLFALAACRKPVAPPPPSLEVGPARALGELGTPVRIGALHASGSMAGGTDAGSLVVVTERGRRIEPKIHPGPVSALTFSSDGKHLLSAGGDLAIWWAVESGTMLRRVKGPQRLTAGLLHGNEAFLGTALGAMVRWPVSERSAEPIRELACAALPVPAPRAQLPESQRCPFGTFVRAEDGSGTACVYPVTVLAVAGETLWRACREGSLYSKELPRGKREGFSVGALRTLTARSDGLLVLGREEGELRLFDPRRRESVGELQPGGSEAAGSAGDLLAVAVGDRVRIWVGASRQASTELPAGGRVVALAVGADEIRYLTEQGKGFARALRLR